MYIIITTEFIYHYPFCASWHLQHVLPTVWQRTSKKRKNSRFRPLSLQNLTSVSYFTVRRPTTAYYTS